ncbi:DNA-3-methyladenine glycosylase I [Proteus hauseri]|uniref:DNA-3-methyladenine glycosylase I n=1 Tax=Proteus cibi TaxID=2050966 RepID=A0ABU6EFE8_9GAMM|nr:MULTISPECIES: DNA-3-methyladenine glycosylase I [Proteus]EST57449.1 DNA-3-methyladenine DNA glycosylase [Proteus hauseri ZMd44]MBG6030662.1 DNA-3-methyladenine glycosylase I [Proteus hauseri]MBS6211238.1 DNA-3-methyladenine glycosylase I [Proteus hauseri]MEB6857811.1 DNA-3-methyladenine glycosylase I [Proteus cibi]MEB7089412.1 DNA-3-methyladenine glycosylase I [Proteus cibi]
MNKQRCGWVTSDPEYLAYHDEEWGKPERDKYKLFEMICLEGQQAGLSWYTVLKKREGFRRCFFDFSPEKIAKMTDKDVETLLQDPAIIRHQGKINAIINNARIFMAMEEQGEDFSQFIWQFVDDKPIINQWNDISQVPASTDISDKMAKALKKKGFKFVGTTTCYAFMQAVGMVDDHILSCFCRQDENKNTNKK